MHNEVVVNMKAVYHTTQRCCPKLSGIAKEPYLVQPGIIIVHYCLVADNNSVIKSCFSKYKNSVC